MVRVGITFCCIDIVVHGTLLSLFDDTLPEN